MFKGMVTLVLMWALVFVGAQSVKAQKQYWQQKVDYTMDIDFDAKSHRFKGEQNLVYYNNSPDTLTKVFYHLYFNAFQPGSMMDVRSRTIADPDRRVGARIYGLKENEIGYHKIDELRQDGKKISYEVAGTILEVTLAQPLLPGASTKLDMKFNSQVPVQIRRSGRDNAEGIAYSMAQWYPKMAEYDYDGWHANPYIGREFHGVWGDFDVTIHIDSSFTIGGTGYLQNPLEIGCGYEENGQTVKRPNKAKLAWHFKAPQVHDFAWAADPGYRHLTAQVPDGPLLHFLFRPDSITTTNWDSLRGYAVKAFQIVNKRFGAYPYKQYSVIQAGDGGMEYPMATFISGRGSFGGLVSVTVHEALHSWYQGMLATNESKYYWMDEGFTSFAQDKVLDKLFERNRLNPHSRDYRSYVSLTKSGLEEPLGTHADHFHTNRAYGTAAYSKGCIFLHQLSYVVGQEAFDRGMLRYYREWRFKHPRPEDFKRVMELETGLELDWYFENWLGTTNTIDYGIKSVASNGGATVVTLENKGTMPMPLDVVVTLKGGKKKLYSIPLRIMRGEKEEEDKSMQKTSLSDWPWPFPEYDFKIPMGLDQIESIEIDPSTRMADVDRDNNVFPKADAFKFFGKEKK